MMRKQKELDMTNNDMKKAVLGNMTKTLMTLHQKVEVLNALDSEPTSSGAFDLVDQLHTMSDTLDAFDAVVARAVAVVPDKSVNENV
jgi:hypothetical protein